MSARQPFSMVPHGDVLARCADLEGDEIALFMVAFFLMLERRGPISDDMPWLARKAGISTRRANQIRAKLLDQGKWVQRGDMLGDLAALSIIERANRRSAINQSNALARWDRAGQPELDFEETPGSRPKKRQKSATSRGAIASAAPPAGGEMQNGGKNGDNPRENGAKTQEQDVLIGQETADFRQSSPEICIPDSRARATPESESDTEHTTESESCEPRALDRLAAVLDAAGLRPSSDEQRDKASEWLQLWTKAGIDLDGTILPVIRATVAESDDPTSSLKRFDRRIRHADARERARLRANGKGPSATVPTPTDDTDPRLAQIRDTLRRDCGGRTYDGWLRPCRLGLDHNGTLIVGAPSQFMADWVQTHFAERIRLLARSLGIENMMIGVASPQAPARAPPPPRTGREHGPSKPPSPARKEAP